ncbi:MAG: penicillin-binding transpeptidase domain-containing protein [Bacilli bacterium]
MFSYIQNKRIKIVLLVVLTLFFLVIVRVFYIQVVEYKKLKELSDDLWSRNLPVKADRGKVLDRNGKVIVDNVTTASLILVPNQIINKEKVTNVLSSILGTSYDEMKKHVYKKTSIERVHPEGRNLSFDIVDKINSYGFDGVYLLKESKRNYLYDNLLSHSLGYVGIDNQGLSGLEVMFDDYLTGKSGSIKYFSDGKGNKLEMAEVYEEPINGKDLMLTIDLDLQKVLDSELDIAMKKYDAQGAMGISMNPKTGEIYALSSKPDFNPSKYKDYSTETINRNLSIWASFEPGSTFKMVSFASAIEERLINIFEDTYYDTGSVNVAGSTIHCWKHGGHGKQTYLNVIENSCNPGFVSIGMKLGKDKLFGYLNKFGFGEKTGIDLNGEATGIIFKMDKVGPLELATTAFGQGVSVTPLQQANALSAIVNGGTLYTPFIVKTNNEVHIKRKNIISKETSKLMIYALESTIANGGGKKAFIEGYRAGGKTGTAQKVGSDGKYMVGNYILSFIGFMPAYDPQVVTYIAIDNPKNTVQYGSEVSAPIFKTVMKAAGEIFNIKKDFSGIPKKYLWDDERYTTVPDVVGLTKREAANKLNEFNVEYSGSGNNVIEMSPVGNSRVKENAIIKLLLN